MRQPEVPLSLSLVVSFVILIAPVYAWTNPTENPPYGNVAPPINTGATLQTKTGSFFSSATLSGATVNATSTLCIAGDCKSAWSEVGGSNWSVSGSDIYYTTGNAAVGTTSFGAALHALNPSGDNILKLSRGASTSTIFRIGTDGALVVQNQSSDVFTIKSGNVGIGTTGPTASLQVVGTGIRSNYGIGFNNAPLALTVANIVTQNDWRILDTGSFTINQSGASPFFVIAPTSGNVGIGTTAPQKLLHVNGGRLRLEDAGSPIIELASNGAVKGYLLYDATNDDVELRYGGAAVGQLTLKSSGNVGIGTATPAAKLDVNGPVKVLRSDSTPFACDGSAPSAVYVDSDPGGLDELCFCAWTGSAWSWRKGSDPTATCD